MCKIFLSVQRISKRQRWVLMMSSEETNGRFQRNMRVALWALLDTFAIVLSVLITLTVMLHAWDSSVFNLFGLISIANDNHSVSDIIAVVIPLAAISSLAVYIHILRHASHIKDMLLTYSILGICSAVLSYMTVLNLLYWSKYFNQAARIDPNRLNEIEDVVVSSVILIVGLTIALSVRSELNAQIDESIRGSENE